MPKHKNPFTVTQQKLFSEILAQCLDEDIIPLGLGARPEEWGDEGYPSFEILKSGRRGIKELRIPLPVDTWLPKAELWVQALVLMKNVLAM